MPALRDQVFISYSHKDREWFSKLQTMLKPMVRNKIISVWEDTKISAGDEWRGEIKEALERAKAAVLLVSPYFLESDFIAEHELPPLLDAAKREGLVILWVYISHCLYDETEIEHYQAASEISKPLDSLTLSEQNRVLVDVCRKIKAAANPKSLAQTQAEHDALANAEAAELFLQVEESDPAEKPRTARLAGGYGFKAQVGEAGRRTWARSDRGKYVWRTKKVLAR
jgi:hypothetical protein